MFNEIKSSQAQLGKQFSSPAVKREKDRKQKKIENLLVDLNTNFRFVSFQIQFEEDLSIFLAPQFLRELLEDFSRGWLHFGSVKKVFGSCQFKEQAKI